MRLHRVLGSLGAIALLVLVLAPSARADSSWPRQFGSASGPFTIYQPQPEKLVGDILSARAAFSLQKPDEANPTYGVLWFTEWIEIDRDSSTVMARNLDVTKVRMHDITPAEASRFEQLVEGEALQWDLSQSLEQLQAGLASAEKERASVANLDHTPPRIQFVNERSVLVSYDGTPRLEAIDGSNLERVTNTPFAVIHEPPTGFYYLNGANLWYRAKNPLGPWTSFDDPPSSVLAVVPPDTLPADQIHGPPPRVITATEPTELIVTDGKPQYAPLVDDELIYVTNTESDVIREIRTQMLYVLIAGRWFRATSETGPWSYVRPDALPGSFARIPPASPKGNVLASVTGTDEADDAVADSEIPQTSAIRRDWVGFEVEYDGHPQFVNIAGTSLQYAINSDVEVIFGPDGHYYACSQGVWYVSDHEQGPWAVSDLRPIGIEDIPPTCPVYDTRYVCIYDSTPDVVYAGYLPGYTGCYPAYGTVVYGTGYRYRAWRGSQRYFARPMTWGCNARYNPYLSRWSFGLSYWSGFLHVGFRWHSRASDARRDVANASYGPGGYHRPILDDDFAMARTRPAQSTPAPTGDYAPANLYNRSWNAPRVSREANPMPAHGFKRPLTPAPGLPNNVFAGKDGNVYQRDVTGHWKVHEGPAWQPASIPARASVASPKPAREPKPKGSGWHISYFPPTAPSTAGPPQTGSSPGDLEREYRGRERSSDGGGTATASAAPTFKAQEPPPPAPAQAPAQAAPPSQPHFSQPAADPKQPVAKSKP